MNSLADIKTKSGFEVVFKEYFNPLSNYVNQQIHNWEDSKEIVQETFLVLWKRRDKLEVSASLKSYLYTSVRNTLIDFIRRKKKNDEVIDVVKYRQNGHDQELDAFIVRQAILNACEKLKPKNKEIFLLTKMEGLTYEEVSKHLGISKRSVEDNVTRALNILKAELKNHPDFVGLSVVLINLFAM